MLLVDDSADVVLIVQRLAGRAGCEVVACGDTATAWVALRKERPALILLDLNLPGEAGDALCRRIRASPALADLKVAWLSHWDRSEDVLRGLTAGVDYLFTKELLCEPEAWIARLDEILSRTNVFVEDLRAVLRQRVFLPRPTAGAIDNLNRLLRLPTIRRFGPDGGRALLGHVFAQLGRDPLPWLRPDGQSFDSSVVKAVSTEQVAACLIALAEVLGRLLGNRDCAPLHGALTAVANLLCESCSL